MCPPIPFRMSPTGDITHIPYKDHMVAYCKDNKFYMMPGHSYNELQPGQCSMLYKASTDALATDRWVYFGASSTTTIGFQFGHTDGYHIYYGYFNTRVYTNTSYYIKGVKPIAGMTYESTQPRYYVYNPSIFSSGAFSQTGSGRVQSARACRFACCFNIPLTKEQMDEVSAWIHKQYP